jgi:hypothetical protein
MANQPGSDAEKDNKRNPPHRRPMIIRIFRALKRYHNTQKRKHIDERKINERVLAVWTRRVGLFTFGLMLVGIGTLCILHETDKTARIALDANILSQRAFVFVSDVTVDKRNAGTHFWDFNPVIENGGTTPARDLAYFTIGYHEHGTVAPERANFGPPIVALNKWRAVLGPKTRTSLPGIGVIVGGQFDELDALRSGAERAFVQGVIWYSDIFPDTKRHVTMFCFQIRNDPITSGDGRPTFGPCRNHNCTDDDCEWHESDAPPEPP